MKEEQEEYIKYLTEEVTGLLNEVRNLVMHDQYDPRNKAHQKMWEEMVDKAFELHKLVKPRHHRDMLRNRGVSPDEREFYDHIHPIEDLIAYIHNPHANDDPIDQTIDFEIEVDIYSRRWGHDDTYYFKRTKDGWIIHSFAKIDGRCTKDGAPILYKLLDHDSINYPEALPEYLEWLWDQAKEKGLSKDQFKTELNKLAKWINICEKSSPDGIFNEYK